MDRLSTESSKQCSSSKMLLIPTSQLHMANPLGSQSVLDSTYCGTCLLLCLFVKSQTHRKIAADRYVKAANKQQVNFDTKLISPTSFRPGPTEGLLRIDEVDWTSMNSRLLPCEVLEVQTEGH